MNNLVYDSYGKLGSNVKGGNVNQAGTLQQCHSAHAATFSGQYCQVFLRQVKINKFVKNNIKKQVQTQNKLRSSTTFFCQCRKQSTILLLSVSLTPVAKRRWRLWCCTVSNSKELLLPDDINHSLISRTMCTMLSSFQQGNFKSIKYP